jgi:D-lactate dehydrogenase
MLCSDWQGAAKLDPRPPAPPALGGQAPRKVVYMPSCVTRMMGPSASDSERASVHEKLLSLFAKAGYEVVYPEVRPRDSARSLLLVGLPMY